MRRRRAIIDIGEVKVICSWHPGFPGNREEPAEPAEWVIDGFLSVKAERALGLSDDLLTLFEDRFYEHMADHADYYNEGRG